MILGLLSDTHGNTRTTAAGVEILLANGADFLIHCGDVGEGVLDLLPRGKAAFVFGNTDYDRAWLLEEAERTGIRCLNTHGRLSFDGHPVSVTHGDDSTILRATLNADTPGYLFTGHTHQLKDERVGHIRWINPGALQRATRKTVAALDLETDALMFHDVDL